MNILTIIILALALQSANMVNHFSLPIHSSTIKLHVSQPSPVCTGAIEILIESCPEYIDVCFFSPSGVHPLPGDLQKKAYARGNQQFCYRYFDKIDFIQGAGKEMRQKVQQMFERDRPNLGISSNSTNLLKWSSLSYFAVHYCNSTEAAEQKLSLISIQVQRQQKKQQKQKQARIYKKLHGKGFHQYVTLTLQIPEEWDITREHECRIIFEEVLPHTTYVDYNQLNRYHRGMKITTVPEIVDGNKWNYIDIEKPAYLARQYWYQYSTPISEWAETATNPVPRHNKFELELSIHFRYPTPTNATQMVEVPMHPFSKVSLSCQGTTYLVSEDIEVYKGTGKVPVGNSDDARIVAIVTLICEVACAMLLVKQLRRK